MKALFWILLAALGTSCSNTATNSDTGASPPTQLQLACLRAQAHDTPVLGTPPLAAIGTGYVADNQAEWVDLWNRLVDRKSELPPRNLPPRIKAVSVTERPGTSCESYIRVDDLRFDDLGLHLSFRLIDIRSIKGAGGSSVACLGEFPLRSLTLFVPERFARHVQFTRLPSESIVQADPPALSCPTLTIVSN